MKFHNVRGQIKNSFCDWPEKISTVIFLGGCNFRCPTCHNLELVHKETPESSFLEILSHIQNNLTWLDGIVISGGEPTLDPQIFDLVKYLSKFLPIKVDTNGSFPEKIQNLLPYVDKFSVDIKGPFEKYPTLTGNCVNKEYIEDCFKKIFHIANNHTDKFEFRTTYVPYLEESDLDIIKNNYLPHSFKLKIQKYQEV